MASIRRTLSPVPRPGTLLNGEASPVASPLSKSSSWTPPVGLVSSPFSSFEYALYRAQAFILGLLSKRSSRPLERQKLKGQFWRKSLVLFVICFVVGVFVGLTPFASSNSSGNLNSKQQEFSFEVVLPSEKVQLLNVIPGNVTPSVDSSSVNDNAISGAHARKLELRNGTSDDNFVVQPTNQNMTKEFRKLLIIVTPTYARPFQAYYLNRLADTLKLVPPSLLWIVVDMGSQSAETAEILRRNGGVIYRHLECSKNLTDVEDKGVHQRNVALSHIETHHLDGIVYFADEDNIYSVDIFEQMRQIRRFGTWMMAKLKESDGEALLEGPMCNGTKVIGWHTSEVTRRFRRFHAEISGFAFNSTILWDIKSWHRPTLEPIRQLDTVNESFQVSTFIEQIVKDESLMECLPQDRLKIMVWHLHVESLYPYPPEWFMKNNLDAIASLA